MTGQADVQYNLWTLCVLGGLVYADDVNPRLGVDHVTTACDDLP